MKILHLLASPRQEASNTWWLSQQIVTRLRSLHPQAQIVLRDLHASAIGHVDAAYADALGSPAFVEDAGAAQGTLALSDLLIAELEAADQVVIGTSMHNYTVPSVLKAWIDHVVRVRRTFGITPDGKVGLLHDRPVHLAVVSGGRFTGASARQPDFLTPYLKVALATIGLHDLRLTVMEGLAAGAQVVRSERERVAMELDRQFSRA
ncbi:NAD(P)H dehydrogenase (quinone) [Herbaspirillum frisingense GSF30]|uniref:FMN dependent NADH:quinone oxidoreductase n=1 Tax=Herbaspirillum frisingense GSF30 TaxID=864073 RepID=A0AAI9IA79_9BURK|nr:NAD(P)H-dependent oxidoreductase [Herbaspirillum frisingense]EOA02456.1 NAD(P)H dehydrogenase (quinone) [Herbaspirillum frisingense GSF30]